MIIIDIDMPQNCHDCPCWDYEYDECQIMQKYLLLDAKKLEDCPLKEVPKDKADRFWQTVQNNGV